MQHGWLTQQAGSWQKRLRSSLTSYTHAAITHNSMVALRLRWVRRFSTLVGCANAMVPRSALQACVFVREVVSRSGRSGPDSSACRTDFISTFCTQCPLAFGGFPLPLRSKLNSCRMQKPNRGKNQVKESSLVTDGFRKALVLPFTFFSENEYGLLHAETVRIHFPCICVSQRFNGLSAARVSSCLSPFPAVGDAGSSSPWDVGDLLLG